MICKLQNSAWKPPKTRVLSDFAISLLAKVTYDISHIYDIGNCFFLSLMHRLVWLGDCRAIVGVTTNQLGWEPSQIHVLRKCVICVQSHLYLVLMHKALWEVPLLKFKRLKVIILCTFKRQKSALGQYREFANLATFLMLDFFKRVNGNIAWKGRFQVNSTPKWSQKPWIQSRPTRSTQPCPVKGLQII